MNPNISLGRAGAADHSVIVFNPGSSPWVNLATAADRYELATNLGCTDDDEVTVDVVDRLLTIRASTSNEICRDVGTFLLVDRRDHTVEQSFALPFDADETDIVSRFDNGVLTLIIRRRVPLNKAIDLSAWRSPHAGC